MNATDRSTAIRTAAHRLTRAEAGAAQRALNQRRRLAFGLVVPVLLFITFGFVAPVV